MQTINFGEKHYNILNLVYNSTLLFLLPFLMTFSTILKIYLAIFLKKIML